MRTGTGQQVQHFKRVATDDPKAHWRSVAAKDQTRKKIHDRQRKKNVSRLHARPCGPGRNAPRHTGTSIEAQGKKKCPSATGTSLRSGAVSRRDGNPFSRGAPRGWLEGRAGQASRGRAGVSP